MINLGEDKVENESIFVGAIVDIEKVTQQNNSNECTLDCKTDCFCADCTND